MFKLATLLSILLIAVSAQITIDPVTFNQCETANISWSGGTGKSLNLHSGSANEQLHTTYTSTPTGKIPWHKSFPTSKHFNYMSITLLTCPSARLAPIDNTSTTWLVTLLAGEELRVNVRGSDDILIVEDFTPAVTIGRSCSCHPISCTDS